MKPWRKQFGIWVPDKSLSDERGFINAGAVGAIAGSRRRTTSSDYTTNMILELIGDNAPSGSISSWTPTVGGTATQATSSKQPTRIDSDINGHHSVDFDGGDVIGGGSISVTGNSLTAFAVAYFVSTGGTYGRVLSLGVTGNEDYNNTSYAAAICRNIGQQSTLAYRNGFKSTKAVTYSTYAVLESVFDGTNHTSLVNGSAGTPVASTGTFSISDYRLGARVGSDGDWFTGRIAHIRLYSTDIGSTNRSTVRAYLGNLYGITVS